MLNIVREKNEWDLIVEKCDYADFYHTHAYHQLSKKQDEEAVLLYYCEFDKIIALPLLLRQIEGTTYKDATSVYGYAGPITKNITEEYDNNLFKKELLLFFKQQNIVSVFSRLNLFIPHQETCLRDLGKTDSLGRLVYIDLTKTLDEQLTHYHRRLKTYINKSRIIYNIKKSNTVDDLDKFIDLYYKNMRRVNADGKYFFDKQYFLDLMDNANFESELLLAICHETGDIAGGAIFMKKNKIIQYHLSGTNEKYLNLNPVKLLIDEMRIKGSNEGFSFLNLGGGVGSKEDSLFYFKSGFSKDTVPFKVWKYEVDQRIYKDLVRQKKGLTSLDKTSDFFPRYRYGGS